MVALVREANSLLRVVIIGAYIFGGLFVIAGLAFVYMGAVGNIELSFFGQTFKSTSVGIAALFLGAAAIVLLLRRSLTSLDRTVSYEKAGSEFEPSARPDVWPNELSAASLRKALRSMSDQQWQLIEAVEAAEGLSYAELATRSKIGPSILGYRLHQLRDSKLINMAGPTIYLSREVTDLLASSKVGSLAEIRGK